MWETIIRVFRLGYIQGYRRLRTVPVPVPVLVIKVVGMGLAELAVGMDIEGLTHSEQSSHSNQINPNSEVSKHGPTRLY